MPLAMLARTPASSACWRKGNWTSARKNSAMVVVPRPVRVVDEAGVIRPEHRGHEIPRDRVRRMHLHVAVHADHLLGLLGDEPDVVADEADRDLRDSRRSRSWKDPSTAGSRFAVGSSSSSNCGSLTRARRDQHQLTLPSGQCANGSCRGAGSPRLQGALDGGVISPARPAEACPPREQSEPHDFFDRDGNWASTGWNWGMYPMRSRARRGFSPKTLTVTRWGRSRPSSNFSNVLLPPPLGPMIETKPPP